MPKAQPRTAMPPELAAFLAAELRGADLDGVRLEAAPAPYWRWATQARIGLLRDATPDGPPFPVED
jgi:hypothetical protein